MVAGPLIHRVSHGIRPVGKCSRGGPLSTRCYFSRMVTVLFCTVARRAPGRARRGRCVCRALLWMGMRVGRVGWGVHSMGLWAPCSQDNDRLTSGPSLLGTYSTPRVRGGKGTHRRGGGKAAAVRDHLAAAVGGGEHRGGRGKRAGHGTGEGRSPAGGTLPPAARRTYQKPRDAPARQRCRAWSVALRAGEPTWTGRQATRGLSIEKDTDRGLGQWRPSPAQRRRGWKGKHQGGGNMPWAVEKRTPCCM